MFNVDLGTFGKLAIQWQKYNQYANLCQQNTLIQNTTKIYKNQITYILAGNPQKTNDIFIIKPLGA